MLLDEDIPHVRGASKVSLAELEKDMSQLRNNLKEVEREIEFQRVQPAVPGDMFLPVMKEFLTTATCKFSELEDLFQDMKTRVSIEFQLLFRNVSIEYKQKINSYCSCSSTEQSDFSEKIILRYNQTISLLFLILS